MDDKIHTCNIRVWAEIKGAIVVFWWVGTVGRNVLPDFLSEVEVADHELRDCTVVGPGEGGVEPRAVISD